MMSSNKSILTACLLSMALITASAQAPQLNGEQLTITVVQESGFLDITKDSEGNTQFSGFLIDMLESLAKPERANFQYTLLPPSGYASACSPVATSDLDAYEESYHTQYNCGTGDVNEVDSINRTDMYLGMYYVTPGRQLKDRFTIPFLPPYSGTPGLFGTATGISGFEDLAEQQAQGLQAEACAPAGTALIDFVKTSYPGLQVKGLLGGEEAIFQAFNDGTCETYIVDGPIASQAVLRYSRVGRCMANGMPIGTIGEPMDFGLSHYAIGIRKDIRPEVEETLSYWMNILMSCSPLDPEGACPEGNLATFFRGKGGTGTECGYVQYPEEPDDLSVGAIVGLVLAGLAMLISLIFLVHWMRLRRQIRQAAKRNAAIEAQAQRERKYNEWIANEVGKPLDEALIALGGVSAKATDFEFIPSPDHQDSVVKDIKVIDTNLECVSALLASLISDPSPPETAAGTQTQKKGDDSDQPTASATRDFPGVVIKPMTMATM